MADLMVMDEDVLSDFVPSNIVSRQQSEGADDGESEYVDEGMSAQEDELVSDDEQEGPVAGGSSPSKLAKIQQTAERQQKKRKRKAEESQLHVKRQEMDKSKITDAVK
jgi:SWI/SNF-related matrix-associated actin-dependent regulator of chromatin subfamily A member 5